MKAKLFTFLILLLAATGNTFSQNWQWGQLLGGGLDDGAESIARDSAGNIYVTGWFRGASYTLDTITLNNAFGGTGDVFVAKFTAGGNVIWAKRYGNVQEEKAMGISVTPAGDVYVTGFFVGPSIIFGNDTLTNSSSSKNDLFVTKFNAQGVTQWARKGTGSDHDYGHDVAVSPDGGVVVTGMFYSIPLTFGTYTLTNTNINYTDLFVAKYDAQGNVKWAKQGTGNSPDAGNGIDCDANGNIYVTGGSSSNPLTVGSYSLAANVFQAAFLIKYDSAGTVKWARNSSGNDTDEGHEVAVDQLGGVYVVGEYKSTNFTVATYTLLNLGNQDVFVAKYDTSGTGLWARRGSGSSYDRAYSVTTDSAGSCYLTGYFSSGTFYFNGFSYFNISSGSGDIFVAKYDKLGNFIWAGTGGGNDYDYGTGIIVNNGKVAICGSFTSPTITLGTTTLTATDGYFDAFVAGMGNATTGLSDAQLTQNDFVIAPNPSSGEFTVTGADGGVLQVTNVLGEIVHIEISSASLTRVKLNVPDGVYLVRLVKDREIVAIKKLVIGN